MEIVSAVFIHLILPIAGVAFYLRLLGKMKLENVSSRPGFDFFAIFFFYGGLLMTILTELFWRWSGAASLGFFMLVTAGPLTMIWIALRNYKRRTVSRYNRYAFQLAVGYLVTLPLSVFFLLPR